MADITFAAIVAWAAHLVTWAAVAFPFGITFGVVVLIRITTPRMRLESLSRLGWVLLMGQLGVCVLLYLVAGLFV